METDRRTFLKKSGFALLGLSLLLIGVDSCEEGGAMTIPAGRDSCIQVYWGNHIGDPTVEAHENTHCEQIKEEGAGNFIKNYLKDPCKYELEASQGMDYPGCSEK